MTAAPGWPETIIDLTARTITLGAVTRPLTGLDVEAEILPLLAAQATDEGTPSARRSPPPTAGLGG